MTLAEKILNLPFLLKVLVRFSNASIVPTSEEFKLISLPSYAISLDISSSHTDTTESSAKWSACCSIPRIKFLRVREINCNIAGHKSLKICYCLALSLELF